MQCGKEFSLAAAHAYPLPGDEIEGRMGHILHAPDDHIVAARKRPRGKPVEAAEAGDRPDIDVSVAWQVRRNPRQEGRPRLGRLSYHHHVGAFERRAGISADMVRPGAQDLVVRRMRMPQAVAARPGFRDFRGTRQHGNLYAGALLEEDGIQMSGAAGTAIRHPHAARALTTSQLSNCSAMVGSSRRRFAIHSSSKIVPRYFSPPSATVVTTVPASFPSAMNSSAL